MTNLSAFVPPPGVLSIIDVVRDFGAVGDAVIAADGTVTGTDNTAAFVAALAAAQPAPNSSVAHGHWVYVPPGVFMVSDRLDWRGPDGTAGCCIRVIGQHVDVSEVVLKNAATGYGSSGSPKPLFYTCSQGVGSSNTAFKNAIRDLTITVGAGNPGANAVDMNVSNTGGMKNVRIRTVDPARAGLAGLELTRQWPGPAYFENLTVEGFNVGINVGTFQYSVTFEHVTLLNQLVAGLRNSQNGVPIRDLTSSQSDGVPAVLNTNSGAFTTVIEANLSATGGTTAIDNTIGGFLRLRNIRTSGYVNKLANLAVGGSTADLYSPSELGDLDDFVNGTASTLFSGQRLTPLRLPVMEAPEYYDTNSSDWANVMDYGAFHSLATDVTSSIQAAFDSGKSTVYFPASPPGQTTEGGTFVIGTTITIPPTVNRVIGMMSQIMAVSGWPSGGNTPGFRILDGTDAPLFIENLWCSALSAGYFIPTTFTDGVTTAGSNAVTSAASNFTSALIGYAITDSTNDTITTLPANTFITAVPDNHTLTLSANALVNGTARNLKTGGNPDLSSGLKGSRWFEHAAARPLVMSEVTMSGGAAQGAAFRSGCGPVHLKGCYGGFVMEPGVRVWARGHDVESVPDRKIQNNGGDLWAFGLKTERYGTIVRTTNGGRTEVEGGFHLPINPDWSQDPQYECIDSQHSLSYASYVFQQYHASYGVQIRETKNGVTHDLLHSATAKRVNAYSDVVPLHIGRLV